MYLSTSISLFGLPSLLPWIFSGPYQTLTLPYILPIAHIGMVGSIYSSLALSIERYAAVVHPFAKYK
jgi:hypothetical protein